MNTEQVQIQTGNHSKSAARDYVEIHQYLSEKCWLLQASLEEKDRFALNDEAYFKRRFGFNAPLEQRNDVIEIKNKFDFTDKEIRLLKFSGLLTAKKGLRTSICAYRSVYLFGITYIFLSLIFIIIPPAILLTLNNDAHWFYFKSPALVAMFFIIIFYANIFSLWPINLLKQRKFNIGDKFSI